MSVRVRMAPSPTGEYHIGHIRTVLYNVVLARKNKGTFIIRIEDTDRTRFIEGATERILDVISDYGFEWDEGPGKGGEYGPYIQSERLHIYKEYAERLIEKKAAYYCFCSSDRLAAMREEQKKKKVSSTKYDRHCLKLSDDEIQAKLANRDPYVIRLRVPENRGVSFEDVVYGKVSVNSNEIDDQILLKSDGFPTYQLAVVVDDHLMKITHVMRGNDWLPSTPKHVLLYEAFGWEMPVHIHLPNLKELGSSKKLSKRFGPVSAREFLDQGYLPEALVNFLMFLGWNPGTEKELYTLEEFIKDFDPKKIHKTDLVAFDRKKLDWMNSQYIQNISNKDFASRAKKFVSDKWTSDLLEKIAPLVKSRIKKFSELPDLIDFFIERPEPLSLTNMSETHINKAIEALEQIDVWSLEEINNALAETVAKNSFKTGDFYMDLRGVLTGKKFTPPINESIEILGKDETLARLKNARMSK